MQSNGGPCSHPGGDTVNTNPGRPLAVGIVVLSLLAFSAAADAQSEESILEEIVVTAMKRGEQRLLDVPLSVSAFSGDRLEDIGARGIADYLQLAPGASLLPISAGDNRIQIRGVSAGVGEATVGYYLDELPAAFINQATLPDARSFDLARTEVLRGPQGTLYGAGAIAGVVRMITRDPVLDAFQFKGDSSFSGTSGGGDNYDANLAVNVPVVSDKFGLRAVATHEDLSGWIDYPNQGLTKANDSELRSYRLKALLRATDNLDITYMGWRSDIEAFGTAAALDDATNPALAPLSEDHEYQLHNLKVTYSGSAFDVVSSSSFSQFDLYSEVDFVGGFALFTVLDPETFTQEFRFNSTTDSDWQWTAGAFYRDAEQNQVQDSDFLDLFGLPGVDQLDEVESRALFGEVSRLLMDGQLELTAGLRWFDEDRTTLDQVSPGATPIRNSSDEVTGRLNLAYRPTDQAMYYINFGSGFRPGINQFPISLATAGAFGVELPAAATPETVYSLEVGSKGQLFDNRLVFDVALFHLSWQDLQAIVPIIQNTLSGVRNTDEATSTGLEVALTLAATDNLMLNLSGSWNNAEYASDVFATQLLVDPLTGLPTGETGEVRVFAEGQRLDDVPEYTINGGFDYRRELFSDYSAAINVTAQHRAKVERTISGVRTFSDDYTYVTARLGLENNRWAFYVFANNLFDEDAGMSVAFPPQFTQLRLRPRTIGLNIRYSYQ